MGNDYSSYINEIKQLPSNICVIHLSGKNIYGVDLSPIMIQGMQQVYRKIWNKEIEVKSMCSSITKLVPHKHIVFDGNETTSIKSRQLFCGFHRVFCNLGWSLLNSSTLTYKYSWSTWFYFKSVAPFTVDGDSVPSAFCAIGLRGGDKLQFIDFPNTLENSVIECIRDTWGKGIQKIENKENSLKVKLCGYPWSCFDTQCLDARFLVLRLIRFMSHHNWKLTNSTATGTYEADTMFFRYFPNSFVTTNPESISDDYFMLYLMKNNYFSILGVDNKIVDMIAKSCAQHESKGVKYVGLKYNYPCVQLVSYVWSRRFEKEMETRKLMTLLFQDLGTMGWIPIESIDCSRQLSNMSSIVFVRSTPVRMMYFCICPRKYRSICLINAIEDVQNIVLNVFVKYYPIKRETIKMSIYGVAYSIDFDGDPFLYNVHGVLVFQIALAAIISALKDVGWNLMLSADTSNEIETETDNENKTTKEWKNSIEGLWFGKILN